MHGQQCQGCGSYDDSSTRGVNPCEHCSTLICQSCTRNHSPLCKELQARKLRGEGPTIGNVPMFAHRRGHETPPTTGPDRPDLAPTVESVMMAMKVAASMNVDDLLGRNPITDSVDQQIDAMKKLQSEQD